MADYIIRALMPVEAPLLKDFLYGSIFQPPGAPLLPKEVIWQPELRIYFEDFGKMGDHCLVAEREGRVIGAAWVRILSGSVRGYGNIGEGIPEFAISLQKEFRNQGVGTALMKALLALLKEKGYEKASLSVQKANYAVNMYRALGFEVFRESEEEYILVYSLNERG